MVVPIQVVKGIREPSKNQMLKFIWLPRGEQDMESPARLLIVNYFSPDTTDVVLRKISTCSF